MEAGAVPTIDTVTLRFDVTIASAAVQLPGAPFLIDRIDWRGNGGSVLLATQYASELYAKLAVIPQDRIKRRPHPRWDSEAPTLPFFM